MVGGRLGLFWRSWEARGAEPWVIQVLKVGYLIPFISPPPLSSVPIPLPSYTPGSVRGLALAAAVDDLLAKGAIEPAPPDPGFYSRLFVTPKVTGGWRPVIDLSRLNVYVKVSHFRMETSQSVLQSLRSADWMISLDLWDAYLQVPVHPDSRKFLRFCFRVFLLLSLCSELGIRVDLPRSSLTGSDDRLSWNVAPDRSFLGFSRSDSCLEGARNARTLFFLQRAAALSLAFPTGGHVLPVHSRSRLQAPHAVLTASPVGCFSSRFVVRRRLLGRLLPNGSSVVVRSSSSPGRGRPFDSFSSIDPLHRRIGLRVGYLSRGRPSLRLVVSRDFTIFDQPPRTSSCFSGGEGLPASSAGSLCVHVHGQHVGPVLPPQGRGHQVLYPPFRVTGGVAAVRGQQCHSASSVCAWQAQCPRGFAVSRLSSPGVGVAPLSGCGPVSLSSLAHDDRSHRHVTQPSAPSLLLPDARLQAAGVDALIQPWDHLQEYAFLPFSLIPRVLAKVQGSSQLELPLVAPFWPLRSWLYLL